MIAAFEWPERVEVGSMTPSDCMASTSRVWLWPFTQGLRARRSDREPLCAALAGHEATRARVDAFLSDRARFLALIDEIQHPREEGSEGARTPPASAASGTPTHGIDGA